jgi:hypothetical protein
MKSWFYYFDKGKAVGPLNLTDLVERITDGEVGPYQLVFREGDIEWVPALALSELREAASAKVSSQDNQWIILRRQDGGAMSVEPMGPFSSQQIRDQIQTGKINYTDYVWKEGMHQWRRIALLREFQPSERPSFAVKTPEKKDTSPVLPEIEKISAEDIQKSVEKKLPKMGPPPIHEDKPTEAEGDDQADVSFKIQEIPPPVRKLPELPKVPTPSEAVKPPPRAPEPPQRVIEFKTLPRKSKGEDESSISRVTESPKNGEASEPPQEPSVIKDLPKGFEGPVPYEEVEENIVFAQITQSKIYDDIKTPVPEETKSTVTSTKSKITPHLKPDLLEVSVPEITKPNPSITKVRPSPPEDTARTMLKKMLPDSKTSETPPPAPEISISSTQTMSEREAMRAERAALEDASRKDEETSKKESTRTESTRTEKRDSRDRKSKKEKTRPSGEAERDKSSEKETAAEKSGLAAIWKQAVVVLLILGFIGFKMFYVPEQPVPPPPPPQAAAPQPVIPIVPQAPQPPPPPPPPEVVPVPVQEVKEVPDAPELPPIKKIVKKKVATRLKLHINMDAAGGASMSVETDAPPEQPIWLEVVGLGGQLTDQSHFYKKIKWNTGKPLDVLDGEISSGYYKMRATAGDLTMEEKFEIGVHEKGFSDRLKRERKIGYNEFWSERKRLFLTAKSLEHALSRPHRSSISELDRMGQSGAAKMIFPEIWNELIDIYKNARGPNAAAAASRLAAVQTRIASLSLYR